MIKLYFTIGLCWSLFFMGWWCCKEYRRRGYGPDPLEIGLGCVIFICTWIAWPWSIVYNVKLMFKRKEANHGKLT